MTVGSIWRIAARTTFASGIILAIPAAIGAYAIGNQPSDGIIVGIGMLLIVVGAAYGWD